MNALELADKLDKSQSWMDALHTQYKNGFGKYCALPKEVATMLRQQQAEIEALKNILSEIDRQVFNIELRDDGTMTPVIRMETK